jgi:hypothetical protein
MKAWTACLGVALMVATAGCGGSTAPFTLSNATVDPNHPCASGSRNVAYDLHATVTGHNSSASAVSISAVSAVMTLAAVHGGWLQPLGSTYTPDKITVTPDRIGAGSTAILNLTIPSACTNLAKGPGTVSYGDYSVTLRFVTSAGAFTVTSANRHRIVVF